MKGRKPNIENVVPLKGDVKASDFDAFALQRARELRPDGLSFEVKAKWDELAPALCHPTRPRLHEGTAPMFKMLCEMWARYDRVFLDVWEGNDTFTTGGRNGVQERNRPQIGTLHVMWDKIRALANDFGMTPAAERGFQSGGQLGFSFDDEGGGSLD